MSVYIYNHIYMIYIYVYIDIYIFLNLNIDIILKLCNIFQKLPGLRKYTITARGMIWKKAFFISEQAYLILLCFTLLCFTFL